MESFYGTPLNQMGSLVVGACGCFFLLLALALWIRKGSASSPLLPLPPGSFGFLWIGETLQYLHSLHCGDAASFLHKRTAKFQSKTFKTRIFFHPTAIVQGVAANRFLAVAENKQQLLNSWPTPVLEILGEHIPVVKHGAQHRRLRQIMASCLGPLALRKLVAKADKMTQLHFDTCWKDQGKVSLLDFISEHTFRIACSLLAGAEEEALVARLYLQFKTWTAGIFSFPLDLPGTAFRKAKSAKRMLVHEMCALIDRKQETTHNMAEPQEEKSEDLLCMLMRAADDNGSFLTREELVDIILFLLFAGYDTSTSTLTFVLKFLEQNPTCYHRLLREHNGIASQKIAGESLSWANVQNMKYTWAIIQETLRLRPVVVGGMKETKHDLSFDGFRIPTGWKMYFDMSSTHNDENIFPEPGKFDPSRFDIERLQEGHGPPPYAYVPFGIGPHSCPGGDFARMTLSIYLHHLTSRKFKWTSINPNEKYHMFPTPKLADGYMATISLNKSD